MWRNTGKSRWNIPKVLWCLVVGHDVDAKPNTYQVVQVIGIKYQLECYRCSLMIEIVENKKIVGRRKDQSSV